MAKDMTPEERLLLSTWVDHVRTRFGLGDVEVPVEDLLALAGAVSTGVARPAVPVTAFITGYLAAVRAQGAEEPDASRAVQDVTAVVPEPTTDRRTNGSTGRV
ncbi:DUF6457 domain-containing protein [Kocuria nitroreducens]|uniref:DUF6457 domain-containing protein n=1 Tax=Kocuria nitroreducens TaxID=3058914 RepID=UPI0036D85332